MKFSTISLTTIVGNTFTDVNCSTPCCRFRRRRRLSMHRALFCMALFFLILIQLSTLPRVLCDEPQTSISNENVSRKSSATTTTATSNVKKSAEPDKNLLLTSSASPKDSEQITDDENPSSPTPSQKQQQKENSPSISSDEIVEKVSSDKIKVEIHANQTKVKSKENGAELSELDKIDDDPVSSDVDIEDEIEENQDDLANANEDDLRYSGQAYQYALKKIYQLSEKKNSLTEHHLTSKLADPSNLDVTTSIALLQEAAKLGYDIAKLVLAKLYFYGDLVPMNHNEAFRLFTELSTKGNGDAHLYLGFMYSIGLGPVKSNQAKALLHYTFGALANSTFAQLALGYRYWSGISVSSNCEFALSHYHKVASKVEKGITFSGSTSIQRIRLLDEHENPGTYNGVLDDDLIQYYQFLADKGDVQAQVGLGQLHFQGGRGVELNPNRAFHYFKLAAESGNTNAMAFLGKMHLEGNKVVEKDLDLAYKYFKMASEKGNPVGQSGLGIMYLHGKGVEKDFAMAFKYFTQAALQGWVDGQLYLGVMYLKGYSVTKDPKSAIKYFTLASQSGHILGFYNLAEMHATGTGTKRSCSTAVELFKSVSERGPWGSTLMEAHNNYKEGKRENAFIKYAVLSELGYEVAQSNAAFMLDRDELFELFNKTEVHERAFMYWSRSATQGSSAARVKLGDYHYYGLGTAVDYEMAANQYRIASELQSNAQALFNLGYMYETGLGLRRDIYLAKRYYDLAAVTSVEAQVPVFLALIKLFFIFACEYLYGFNDWSEIFSWSPKDIFGDEWDLYFLTFLATLMATIFYLRRPAGGPPLG